MIKVNEFPFTGYPVTDLSKSVAFYEGILGLKRSRGFDEKGRFWLEYDLGETTLAISNLWKPSGQSGPGIAMEVEDFPEAIQTLKKNGVRFLEEAVDYPVCNLAVVADPDGNAVTIHKRKPNHNF